MKSSKEESEIAPKLLVIKLTRVSFSNASNLKKFLMLDIQFSLLETQVALNPQFGKFYKLPITLLHSMRKIQTVQRTPLLKLS
jgi:hypothetical protein